MHEWKIITPVVTEVALQYISFSDSLVRCGFIITDWDVTRPETAYFGYYNVPVSYGRMVIVIYVKHQSESQMTLWQMQHLSEYEWKVQKF